MKLLFRLLLFCVPICAAFSCGRGDYAVFSGYAQGGTYTVKVNMKGVQASRGEVAEAIAAILEEVDTTLSGYNRSSLLSRFNAGESVEKSPLFLRAEELSEHYRQLTDGAFDAGAAPLFDLWGFGFRSGDFPSERDVREAMDRCAQRKTLNFNAIAQGLTCDLIASYLKGAGVNDMLVDIGEIWCCGLNPRGEGWAIGIDTPEDGNDTPGASLSGVWRSDGGACGVVTSGNYRKYYIKDGVKYAHTIDPRTGYPVQHSLLSATVVAPTAAEADALATFFMVVGEDCAREWVLSHEDIEACLISSGGKWTSPGFLISE